MVRPSLLMRQDASQLPMEQGRTIHTMAGVLGGHWHDGAAVLLVSAELDEILSLSDRIGVIYRGMLAGGLHPADTSRESLGLLMAGGALT